MIFFRNVSIQRKIVIITALSSLLSLLVIIGLLINYEFLILKQTKIRELTIMADIIGNSCSAAIIFKDAKTAQEIIRGLRTNPHILGAAIYTEDGNIFANYKNPAYAEIVMPERPGLSNFSFRDNRFYVYQPIFEGKQHLGTIYIQADLFEVYKLLWHFALIVISLLVLYSLKVMLISSSLKHIISRPILALAETATRVSTEKNFSLRAKQTSQDEIGILTNSFNEMLTQIQQSDAALDEARRVAEQRARELEHSQVELSQIASELERSNKELAQFAYVASHDLQQPLRTIGSFIELLSQRYQGKLDSTADDFIKRILQSLSHMRNLIDDLLSYSRAGSSVKPFEVIDCEEIFKATILDLKALIDSSAAKVTCDSLPQIFGDRSLISQLFQNLLENAIKFHGNSVPEVSVKVKRCASEWQFSVKDNGIGIPAEYLDKIFVIFQRLHVQSKYPGTGIGLAVCKKIVERHNGKIWCESEVGKGTTFFFTVPVGAVHDLV